MKEKIGNVTINYEFYKENDYERAEENYDRLLQIIHDVDDVEAQLLKESDGTLLYRLSPIRHNLLKWYEFEKDASLLELRAGCGALTSLYCEKVGQVVSVEASKQCAIVNATRHVKQDNLEICVGRLKDICFTQKFDYITMIGALEYAAEEMATEDPFVDMLKLAKSLLKPNGKLIIAIENKYGLKYWAGATESHTGKLFGGIQGYANVDAVRTFSRKALKNMLKKVGFVKSNFYYPIPDYKLPFEIYSEKYLPKKGDIKSPAISYDRERYAFFDETFVYDSICEDGLFEEFANAFLIISE